MSVKLWEQDVDAPLLNQQDLPYYILISGAGDYSINKITYYEEVYDIYSNPPDISYVFVTLTTNLGTMTVIGGQVKYDN